MRPPPEEGEEEQEEEESPEETPERPLECSECKKRISVHYTEIVGDSITVTGMCADCPELQRRLYGTPHHVAAGAPMEGGAGLACGNCGTAFESVKMGNPLGCSECYAVFDEMLLSEMLSAVRAPSRLSSVKKGMPLHLGRATGEVQEMSPSLRLLALNEALNETLKREDYEQAAWLRDQIKALSENQKKGDDGKQ
ncbi:MAG: UvrB/UvrC motif-containing protein [Parachlamydia sp.]|nr:UvrB/UvrC motif-containing protein [Parachlamydia sp.]